VLKCKVCDRFGKIVWFRYCLFQRHVVHLSYQTNKIKSEVMTKQVVNLTEKEIADQVKYANKYFDLIQKELSYGNLVNLENVNNYTKAYQIHSELAKSGCVTI